MSAPIAPAPAAAPVAAAPAAAPAPVAAAPAAAPVAAAPAAAPASAPAAAPAAAPAGPVGLPAGFGGPPEIGSVSGGSSGFPEEHFYKPILFRLLSVESRQSKFKEGGTVDVPTVDYIVLDPATGAFEERKGVTLWTGQITSDLANAFKRGEQAITAVAAKKATDKGNPMLYLTPLDDTNSGYGAAQALAYLRQAAVDQFHWWSAAA